MVFADLDLARRLEGLETWIGAEYARARTRIDPDQDTAAVAVAGGFAFFFGADSPLTEAKGLGMNGPVADEELEALERVFHDRGVAAKVMVCPLADPSLLDGLARRGYRLSGFENVLYRLLDHAPTTPEPSSGFTITPDDSGVGAETLARGFVAPDEPGPELRDIIAMSAGLHGLTTLLARVDGEPAGAASLLIRDRMVMLAGASTLPPFRGRGIQTALVQTRLALGSTAGCEIATMGATPGTSSQRNAERWGFRVAYTKSVLVLGPPP